MGWLVTVPPQGFTVAESLCDLADIRHQETLAQLLCGFVTGADAKAGEAIQRAAAREHLKARSHKIGSYLRACVRWLARGSGAALATVGPRWPGPRPVGRPQRMLEPARLTATAQHRKTAGGNAPRCRGPEP